MMHDDLLDVTSSARLGSMMHDDLLDVLAVTELEHCTSCL
jgi:hypothetical protein